ncbi:hypothetical protein E2C06_35910 [Dankookia rubra]|uniref:Uncharacterized protein n=2 Tax=Dankookia rubra TaxID=1442381 RepID=A0A4R5Q3G9_9PROT|nr:hypothetical protein E2C06_35910 [Dankookia rubra]
MIFDLLHGGYHRSGLSSDKWVSRETGGSSRSHDAAVRLALLLLHRCAPGVIEIASTGSLQDWQHTAALVAEILVVFEHTVELPKLAAAPQDSAAPGARARRRVKDTTEQMLAAGAETALAAYRGYVRAERSLHG